MKIDKNSLVLAAAFTGLLGGTMARLNAAPASGSSLSAVLQAADSSDKKDIEKHACKGLNSCKGNGGGSKKEFGKNSCKGQGRLCHRRLQAAGSQVTRPSRGRRLRVVGPFSASTLCQPINSMGSRTTGSVSVSGFLITATSSRKSPQWAGSRSSRRITWSMAVVRWRLSTRFLSVTESSSMAYRRACISASAEPLNKEASAPSQDVGQAYQDPLADRSHLCWGSVDGTYSHDLLPMPYTFEAAEITARKVREARDFLEVPIAVENVSSYAEFHMSEMTEWEFLNEVVERADCGILLDVNNIYVSSRNHDFDPYDYLNSIPAERVAQIHIAGHSKFEKYILDTHDHPVIDPVWKMYEHAIRRIGPTATLLEWDDRIPSFDEVHAEAHKAEKYIQAPATAGL